MPTIEQVIENAAAKSKRYAKEVKKLKDAIYAWEAHYEMATREVARLNRENTRLIGAVKTSQISRKPIPDCFDWRDKNDGSN